MGKENISGPNKIVSLVLGFGRGVLLIGLIYIAFVNSPFKYLSMSTEDRSFSGQYLFNVAPSVYRVGINFYPWERNETPLAKLLEK